MKYYFVSYYYENNQTNGFGNCVTSVEKFLDTSRVEKTLEEDLGHGVKVYVTGFYEIEREQFDSFNGHYEMTAK